MRTGSKSGVRWEIQKIVGAYALFGSAWIYLSDSALSWLITDPFLRSRIEVFKGLLFILFTSALLYQLIGRFARRNADIIRRLAESEEALRQNEEILKALMEEMPAGVGWSDEAGTIQYLNEYLKGSLLEWLGSHPADISTIDDLMLHAFPDQAYRAKIRNSWNAGIAQSRESGTPVPPIEAKLTCRDGSTRHLLLNTRLVWSRIVFIFTDITKWESMQGEILKAQKLESLGVLAGGIAHDFNNILTGILGNISFAGLILDESHQAQRPLEQAEKASLRAAELAHQLLTFAKGGQPVKKTVSVAELIKESLALALHGSKVKGVVEIPASLLAIEADEGQMNQSFNNVIINALQAMPEGGTLSVRAENVILGEQNKAALPAGDYVMISFTDQGVGIPHEELQRIFDPYFTTKAGGTGLGLASVHSIVNKHNGKIEVESVLGRGTTFTFYLPSSDQAPEPKSLPSSPCPSGKRAEGAILVMDDEEAIRDLAVAILEYLGFGVRTCSSGEEAVRLYREAGESGVPFFAAIMDLTIPAGMGGKEAAQEILAYDPDARLIVSSGYSNDPVMAQHADYGFCAAVVKPYRAVDLERALAQVQGETNQGLGARG